MPQSALLFSGLDLYHNQGDLPRGALTVADNLDLSAGMLVSRPGHQAQLTTPLIAPFYGPVVYLQGNGDTTVILSGNSKLYSWLKGATTVTELDNAATSSSFTINSPGFQGCRLGTYGYFVDGANNYPIRTNLATNTAEYANGLNPPTSVPSASLTNLTIDGISTNSGWAGDVLASSYSYTDLVIGVTTTHLSSLLRPFQQYDKGQTITLVSGTGFNTGPIVISSVLANGVAVLASSAGTTGSTGGHATLPLLVTTANTGTYLTTGQADLNTFGSNTSIANGTQIGTSYLANSSTVDNLATAAPGSTQFPVTGAPAASYAALLDVNGVACATWTQFDDAGKGFTTLINGNALNACFLASPNGDRTNAQFFFSAYYYTSDTRGLQTIAVTVSVYSDVAGADFITSRTQVFTLPFNGQVPGQVIQHIFDFPLLSANIGSVVLKVCGGPNNVNAAQFSNYAGFLYVAGVNFKPIGNGLTLVGTSPGIEVQHAEPTIAYQGAFGAVRLTRDYGGTAQNWSAYENIFLPLVSVPGGLTIEALITAGLSITCGFRQSGSTTHNYTNPVTFPSGFNGIAVNISTVPSSVISDFEYFELVFTSDLAVESSTANLFTITGINGAGNLAISGIAGGVTFAPYVYYFTEMTDVDNADQPQLVNVIETDPSGVSNSIQPNAEDAIGQCILPAPINAETNWLVIYRGGGITSAALGYPLKIATCPTFADYGPIWAYTDLVIDATHNYQVTSAGRPFSASDVNLLILITGGTGFTPQICYIQSVSGVKATLYTEDGIQANIGTVGSTGGMGNIGDAQNSDGNNPYILWDHTTRTLTDNTPDDFLNNAEALQYGREQLPTGAQCICAWQNRIFLAVGSTVYGSWNVVAGQESGVYTTTIDSSNDPQQSIKGVSLGVGAADDDTIIALVPIGGYLFILKNYSAWILAGTDPTNFTLTQYLPYGGAGAMAPRGAVASASDGPAYTPLGIAFNHVIFLGGDGLYSFDGSTAKPASIPLLTVLNVKDLQGNVLIPASLYAKIAITFFNKKLFVFAPEVYYYTDLVVDPTTNTHVTSADRPFTSADIGGTLNQTGGSGFNIVNATISNVVGGVAYLSTASGTVSSVGGEANFCAPGNTITWAFDTMVGGFTRYKISGTSAASLSASTDTNDLVICGTDGQIYLLTGVGDKSTPTSSLAPIAISATTGGFGQGSGQPTGDQGYYAKTRPTRLWMDTTSPNASTPYTVTVAGSNSSNNCVVQYTPDQGEDTWTMKLGPSAQGPSITVNVQASAVGQIRLRAIGLDSAKGTIQG